MISTRCRQTSWPRSSCATSTASTSSSARPRPTRWKKDIADLEATLESKRRIRGIIIRELKEIIRKYPSPRRTGIVAAESVAQMPAEDLVPDYPVQLFLSHEGYFKKITPQSLRMSGEQKYKDGDALSQSFGATNRGELLIFTDRQQVYKAKLCDFADTKASVLGVYLPTVLSMDADEHVLCMVDPGDYRGELLLVFENGKVARIPVSAYETKTNRRRLTGAYSDKSPLVAVLPLYEGSEVVLFASDGRALLFPPEAVSLKASRTTQGVAVMALKKKGRCHTGTVCARYAHPQPCALPRQESAGRRRAAARGRPRRGADEPDLRRERYGSASFFRF